MLDKYSESDNISVTDASLKIILYMEQKIKTINKQNSRKTEINKYIKNKYGDEYIKPVSETTPYKDYIQYGISKDAYYSEIDNCMKTIICKEKRKKKLNKLLMKEFSKKYVKLAQKHDLYDKYVNGNDKCIKKLMKLIKNTKLQQSRKSKIDYRIRKYIDKKYRDSIRREDIYNNFIQNDNKSVDEVIEILIKKANKMNEKKQRRKIVYDKIEKKYDMDYWNYAKQLKVCNKYISHDIGDINDSMDKIDPSIQVYIAKRSRGLRNSKADRFLNLCNHNISRTVHKSALYKEYINQYTKKYTIRDFISKVEKMNDGQNIYNENTKSMYFNDNLKDKETSTEKIDNIYTNYEQWCDEHDEISVYRYELLDYLKDRGYVYNEKEEIIIGLKIK